MPALPIETGHVVIIVIAIVVALFMLKVTKKVIGITVAVGVLAAVSKYFGLW